MKKLFTQIVAITIAICCGSFSADAKIWRLNNNGSNPQPQIDADFYGTLQQAHDDAQVQNGDTIHIEQSPTSYGNCIITKKLVLIGSGYFLDKNAQTQVNTAWGSKVGDLSFSGNGGAGTHIMGLDLNSVTVNVSDVMVARNYIRFNVVIGTNDATNTENTMIISNFFNNGYVADMVLYDHVFYCITNNTGTGEYKKVTIQGNIIKCFAAWTQLPSGAWNAAGGGISLNERVGGILKNNIIETNRINIGSICNFYVVNNLSNDKGTNTFKNCRLEYNAGMNAGQFQTPNLINAYQGPSNTTVSSFSFVGGTSPDGAYKLPTGSAFLTGGKSGLEMGAFGGDYPYKLSGLAAIPNIYTLTLAPVAAGSTTMDVNLSTKSNN